MIAEFLQLSASFPTVLFSGALGFVLLYWLMVMIGAVDMEMFDALDVFEGLDGIAEGGAEAGAEAAGEAVAEAAGEAAAEAAGEAAAEAAGEAAAEAAGEAAGDSIDGLADAATSGGLVVQLLHALQVGTVPVTITMSLAVLAAWTISYAGSLLLHTIDLPLPALLTAAPLALFAMVAGLVLSGFAVRPLAGIFRTQGAQTRHDFIGHEAVVRTGRIDRSFGEAECEDGGAGLIIPVRCDRKNNVRRGDRVLIISFDSSREAFVVEPLMDQTVSSSSQTGSTSATPAGKKMSNKAHSTNVSLSKPQSE